MDSATPLLRFASARILLALVCPLGCVLGVLYRKSLRVTCARADLCNILCNLNVALLYAEVCITDKDVFHLICSEPFEFRFQAIEFNFCNFTGGRGAPIAEGALEGAPTVRLPQPDPFFLRIAADEFVKRTGKERGRNLLKVARPSAHGARTNAPSFVK